MCLGGQPVSKSFTIQNTGDLTLTINLDKPPVMGAFSATTTLGEGATIAGHTTKTETVKFAPPSAGSFTGVTGHPAACPATVTS